jgi:integrase
MALTDTAIRQTKPGDKPFKVYDRHGLFLLVNPGGSKLWRWRYRFEGREKLMALGEYPVRGLGEARELLLTGRKLLASGVDPMAQRKAKAEAKRQQSLASQREVEDSFERVARKWWKWWSEGKAPRHVDTVLRRLEKDVFPVLGQKFIGAVTAADVREVMLAIEGREAHDLAKRARETTSQIFRYAIAHGIAARNPAMDFKPSDLLVEVKTKNQPRIDVKELPELLVKMDDYTGDAITRFAMKLMVHTFVRTSELIEAPWTEFDLDGARWTIPKERMKMDTPHIVPLARQAVEVLRALKLLTGDGRLVFPGANDKDTCMSNNTVLFALYRLGYRHRMTGHGFRGLASTILNEHEFPEAHIELQLAHIKRDKVAGAYNHAKYLKQRIKMMEWWADYLDAELAKGRRALAT